MPVPQLEPQPLPGLALEPGLLPLPVLALELLLEHRHLLMLMLMLRPMLRPMLRLPPMPMQLLTIASQPKLQLGLITQLMAIIQLAGPLITLQLVLVEPQLAEPTQGLAMSLALALARPTRRQQGQLKLTHRHHQRKALHLFALTFRYSNL